MPTDTEWCHDCSGEVSTPHTCAAREMVAAGIVRKDMVTDGGWTPHTTMKPEELGDYVEWDAVLSYVARLRTELAKVRLTREECRLAVSAIEGFALRPEMDKERGEALWCLAAKLRPLPAEPTKEVDEVDDGDA